MIYMIILFLLYTNSKGGYWEHIPEGKFWRGPGSFRFSTSRVYIELN